jgi:hypothetical protein
MYKCGWNGCEKAYGTLNHLNAHVTMQSHGSKRTPEGMWHSLPPHPAVVATVPDPHCNFSPSLRAGPFVLPVINSLSLPVRLLCSLFRLVASKSVDLTCSDVSRCQPREVRDDLRWRWS